MENERRILNQKELLVLFTDYDFYKWAKDLTKREVDHMKGHPERPGIIPDRFKNTVKLDK